ncbi:Retrovirus-related Pol polyprotein from transposon TNT 1-94 [Fusarium oxysporum f. sp. albedinis]|nr:Retrovirus-related Pol polyprotein from transposon TNT 1-94 [Fusarium oxysporum f. sp. albedinis]
MVTDLSERDFQTGLSYVAVSRVKMLDGLMIDAPFERASLHYEKLPDGKHSSIMLFTLEALTQRGRKMVTVMHAPLRGAPADQRTARLFSMKYYVIEIHPSDCITPSPPPVRVSAYFIPSRLLNVASIS